MDNNNFPSIKNNNQVEEEEDPDDYDINGRPLTIKAAIRTFHADGKTKTHFFPS